MGQPAEHLPLSQIPRPALAVRACGLPRYRPIRPVQDAHRQPSPVTRAGGELVSSGAIH